MFDFSSQPKAISEYISYKLNIQNRSQKTVYEYVLDLDNFFRYFLKKKKGLKEEEEVDLLSLSLDDISAVTTEDIYEYLLYTATQKNNKFSSRARKLSSIKGFFKYMNVKQKLIEHNPAKDIDTPAIRRSLPKFLSVEECMKLLDAVVLYGKENAKRDYAILTLFLNCGMRLNELKNIKLTDFDSQYNTVKVTGKGSKERMLYLNEACKSALFDYLQERSKMTCNDSKALWVSRNHKAMSDKTIQYTVYKYLKLAGLDDKKYSVHKLRHTAATLMYSTGKVDVRVLKDILGHEQLNTTQIYTHVSNKQMEDATKANPLATVIKSNFSKVKNGEEV